MQITKRFDQAYRDLPRTIQRKVDKQLVLFMTDPTHPSLRVKRVQGTAEIYEGRIDRFYRFTFSIRGHTCILRMVGAHDQVLRNP